MSGGTIREKLILLTLLPVLAFLLLVIIWFGYQGISQSREAMTERGMIMTRYLASMAEFAVTTGNMAQLNSVSEILLDGELVTMRVYDIDHNLLLQLGHRLDLDSLIERESFPTEIKLCTSSSRVWLFCAPIVFAPLPIADFAETPTSERIIGYIELATTTNTLQHDMRRIIIQGLSGTMLMMILLLILIRRVEGEITQPLSELSNSVALISDGISNVTISTDATGELKTLQEGFNTMARTLDKHHSEMEQRIAAATSKLSEAMQKLEQRNRQLQEQTKLAHSASQAKSRFLATMSHEIRTPLSGIIGMLSLLDRGSLPEDQRSYLDHLEQAASSLRMLIEDVLDFSRIEAGKLTIAEHPCIVEKNIESVVMMLAYSAQQKSLELLVSIDPRTPRIIYGDELRFRQILINLIGNAIKFTEQGYIVVRVRVIGQDAKHCQLRFEVEDSGIGIAPELQQAIFDGFTQIDTSMTRQHGGSGLGTTISRELVQLMGGRIGVDSTPGKGSCFWFELAPRVLEWSTDQQALAGQRCLLFERCPQAARILTETLRQQGAEVECEDDEARLLQRYQGGQHELVLLCESSSDFSLGELAARLRQLRDPQRGSRHYHVTLLNGQTESALFDGHLTKPLTLSRLLALHRQSADPTPGQSPQREQAARSVLLAEDDRINATVVSSFLARLGHHMHLARDGQAALEALRTQRFDIALLDLRMPLLDGLSVTRQWRDEEHGHGQHLPIIALTANASEADRQACLAAGMDDFLTKPISIEQLAAILDKYT